MFNNFHHGKIFDKIQQITALESINLFAYYGKGITDCPPGQMKNSIKKTQQISSNDAMPVLQLVEPFAEEISRIRHSDFTKEAVEFAYSLEVVQGINKVNKQLSAKKYKKIYEQKNEFYTRYYINDNSASLGLILTNIDRSRIKTDKNNNPVFWQMGPQRRTLALALRALYFDTNQNEKIHKTIDDIESGKIKIPKRSNKRSPTIDYALGIQKKGGPIVNTPAFSEIGYKKISSEKQLSRRKIVNNGLFNRVGKYPRKILGLGAMPPVSGWRDTLVMSAIGHMMCFIPRSSIFAGDVQKRIDLALDVRQTIDSLNIPKKWKTRALRNVGAALGAENPQEEVKIVKKFIDKTGVKLFRIYTIGSDPRVIETAKLLRKIFGDEIEIFVGQIADIRQAIELTKPKIKVDGLIYGHGGGQQCTSATNGMALSTLEDLYLATLEKNLNNTSIIAEGGIGRSVGTALIMGIDAALGNQKLVRGTIESGDLFIQDKNGNICQPYPGTASPVTQIIEAEDEDLRIRRTNSAGRTYQTEGKPGFMYFKNKANSMAFWIDQYLSYAARTLADLGVENISELRNFMQESNEEYLRILTDKSQYMSAAHWNMN